MWNYKVVSESYVNCKIRQFEDKKRFWILKFELSRSEITVCHLLLKNEEVDDKLYDLLYDAIRNERNFLIKQYVVKPSKGAYHKYTWVDVDNMNCEPWEVSEIERDEDDNPRIYNDITVYAEIKGLSGPILRDVLSAEYVDIDYPLVKRYLDYRGQRRSYRSRSSSCYYEEPDCESWMQREMLYNMSDEDWVMEYIQHGAGEYHGY